MPKLFLLPTDRGKRAIVWSAFLFVCAQAALSVYLNHRRPDLRDPAFGLRLRTLQKQLAENPGAPLVLILGSSRTLNGLSPAHMPVSLDQQGPAPLVFNFALPGSGSIRELMTFRRLRAAGIKPRWLLLESWPVLWPEEGAFAERRIIVEDELCWTDLPVLSHYLPGKLEFFAHALKGNLVPLMSYRSRLLHAGARFLLPRDLDRGLSHEDDDWTCADGTGWLPYRKIPADRAAQRREVDKGLLIAAPLLNPLRIAPDSDRALRDLLNECRADGIKPAVFLMPEHSACRGWYSPQTRALVRAYLTELSKEYRFPTIDMRDWAPDESFADFCHMAPWGAPPLSQRFAHDALRPWLRGDPLRRDVLLNGAACGLATPLDR
ncbi:MAG TPA: hypothetical protein VMG10_18700 [Gemmataceae bacterium]|nr:hypothetical protein [Gemmataceae bacterium]